MRTFRFDYSCTTAARESLFYQTQNSTLLVYRVSDIPTLYLVNTIGYGVVLECILNLVRKYLSL